MAVIAQYKIQCSGACFQWLDVDFNPTPSMDLAAAFPLRDVAEYACYEAGWKKPCTCKALLYSKGGVSAHFTGCPTLEQPVCPECRGIPNLHIPHYDDKIEGKH